MSLFGNIGSLFAAALPAVATAVSGGNPLATALATAASSAIGAMNQNAQNSANVAAQEQFQLQTQDTGYQRAMASMEAAGLNPILAYANGPFSSLSGSLPQVVNVAGSSAQSSLNAFNSMVQLQNTEASTNQIQAQTDNVNQNTANSAQDYHKKKTEADIADKIDTGQANAGDAFSRLYNGMTSGVSNSALSYFNTPSNAPLGTGVSNAGQALGLPW